jgi:hypothetical protein
MARVAVDGIKFTGERVQFEERHVSGGEPPQTDNRSAAVERFKYL